jgi:hypothetical protein
MDKDNIITFKDIFTEKELNMIENDMMVQSYKDDALNNNKKFIKFTIPIGQDIKNKLKIYNIKIDDTSDLPMMWIKGDIHKHIDKAKFDFDYTNLIYITDDNNGEFIIDGISFPIKRGFGYRFHQGLEHETVGTDPNKMRLMIGPISEKGFTVGAGPTILYMLVDSPDYSIPYYIPGGTKFINETQVPSDYIPAPPIVLQGWYVFYVDDINALYKVGDVVPPDTPYNMDYSYWVYPIWETPQPTPAPSQPVIIMPRPAYSDNSLVFYKPHSLAPGGTAGVKNVRVKSRRT